MTSLAASVDVLVIDDAPDAADTLAVALSMDGYNVRVCNTAEAALASIDKDFPLCVLMDFGLPDQDGLDVVRAVRARHGDAIVIVMVTGWDVTRPRVAEAAALVDHYFTKPVSLDKLRQILPPLQPAPGAV